MQASTSALITLITIALWVLAVVARPYTWWKLLLIGGSVVAYVILFAWPFTRDFFALDPSNVAATTSAFVCGAVGIVLSSRSPGRSRPPVRRASPPLAADFFTTETASVRGESPCGPSRDNAPASGRTGFMSSVRLPDRRGDTF